MFGAMPRTPLCAAIHMQTRALALVGRILINPVSGMRRPQSRPEPMRGLQEFALQTDQVDHERSFGQAHQPPAASIRTAGAIFTLAVSWVG